MKRVTINGLENYFGPIPTAFKVDSPYATENFYIQPWWVLSLNRYQRDNLVQLLDIIITWDLLLGGFNSGDWISEILHMLAKPVLSGTNVVPKSHIDEEDHPNITYEEAVERITYQLAYKISKADDIDMDLAMEYARRYLDA